VHRGDAAVAQFGEIGAARSRDLADDDVFADDGALL